MKKVLVFGIFDGVHPGHRAFLRQAKTWGDFLVVAVGQTSATKKFKGKVPKYSLRERTAFVRDIESVDKIVPGDKKQGNYEVIEREEPGVICLGYDQKELADDLKRWLGLKKLKITLKILKPYKPLKYHPSIVNRSTSH